jgi:hypothetical protein
MFLIEPVNGLTIQKTMGSFGVNLITNDPAAQPGIGFSDQSLPGEFFGMIYSRNGFVLPNPELYLIGGNNAGIILNDTVGAVFIGNATITNILDSRPSNALSIGATNATSINLGATTIVDPTKELQANQIDSATAAPLVLGATNTTVAVLNKGAQFLTSGGTPATLNHYEEFDHNTTFTNNTETTASVDIYLVKVGNAITLRITGDFNVPNVPGQVAPAAFFSADTVLPARFRPGQNCNGAFRVSNNGVFSTGWIEVTTAGNINIYNNPDFTTAFTAAVTNGFSSGTFPYSN